jgi:hypothetical protein
MKKLKLKKIFTPKITFALFLMLISNLGWILPILLVPLLEYSLEIKAFLVAGLIVFGQVTYNLGLLLVGANIYKRLKKKHINLKYVWTQASVFFKLLEKRYLQL